MKFNNEYPKKQKWLSVSNILTGIMFLVLLAAVINPDAKALLLRGFMKVGLFRPDIPKTTVAHSANEVSDIDLSLLDSNGRKTNVSDLKGKVIFLNFWATWCPPCKAEMPSINQLYQAVGQDSSVVFFLIDVDGTFEKSAAFLRKGGYALPLVGPYGAIPEHVFKGTLPTTVVVDKSGRVAMMHEGIADYSNSAFIKFIRELVGQKSP